MADISGYLRGVTNEEGVMTQVEEWYHQDAAIDERLKEYPISHWFSPFSFHQARLLVVYHAHATEENIEITIESEYVLEQKEQKETSKLNLEEKNSSFGLF